MADELNRLMHDLAQQAPSDLGQAGPRQHARRVRRQLGMGTAAVLVVGGGVVAAVTQSGSAGDPDRLIAPSALQFIGVAPTPEPPRPIGLNVEVLLTLDRSALRVGEKVGATVELRNTATRGDATYGPVCLLVTQGVGTVPDGSYDPSLEPWATLARSSRISVPAPNACTPGPARRSLPAGAVRTERLTWTAATANNAEYNGPIVVRVQTTAERPGAGGFPSSRQVPARLIGGDPSRVSALGAVDRALADIEVATSLDGVVPLQASVDLELGSAPARPKWRVQFFRTRGSGDIVNVDPETGAVTSGSSFVENSD